MHTELLKVFNQITTIDEKGELLFREIFKPEFIPKGSYFLKSGQRNNKVAFLKKGLVRYYVIKNDEESNLEFTGELEFITDHPSFVNKGVSHQYIQALEDCEILICSYDNLQRMYNELEYGNLIGRKVYEHRFEVMTMQIFSIYMHNKEERYQYFMEQYGNIAQRIPQYLIASYVGVKPESLSRIRRRLSERAKKTS